VSRFDQATWFLLQTVGITPTTMRDQNRRIAIIRQNYQFLGELRGGELVVIRSGFMAVGDKYIRFVHRMFNYETDKMLATSDCTAVEASLETGKSVPLPEELQNAARLHMVMANSVEADAVSDGG
jgi:acyl-CoA thioester hydrolase